MSPITHALIGWVCLERFQASNRDKALVVLAGLAPDLDGLGILVDFATRKMGLPETDYYQRFHHMYCHGLPAAIVIAGLAGMLGKRHLQVALGAFVSVHLHLLCDLLGSRGESIDAIWSIYYFSPISNAHALFWSGQWPLAGWQNLVISIVLLGMTINRATITGYSPLTLVSKTADTVFVTVMRTRKKKILMFFGADGASL